MIAICPLCGQTVPLPADVPDRLDCPHCKTALEARRAGMTAHLFPIKSVSGGQEAVKALEKEADPVKKYAALSKLTAEYPDSLSVHYALLMHGRLHERDPKRLDFSVIKCYLLHPYDEPQSHKPEERAAYAREIFDHSLLQKCLSLAPDADAFLREYLTALCQRYLELFLMGSSRYGTSLFGLIRPGKFEKTLAAPVAAMHRAMGADANLTERERTLLQACLYAAFKNRLANTSYLDELI